MLNDHLVKDRLLLSYRTQMPGKSIRNVKNTIAIASGKGGVGKSTVTVNLAAALSKLGAKVGILDADIYGPSIPMMLGAGTQPEVVNERYLPVIAHGIQAMSIGYLTDTTQALIWRGPMLAKSLLQMLDLTLWDDLDFLFIDLPPGTGDIQLSLVQKIPLAGAIVVTTPQQIATLDAQKAITLFNKTSIPVLGLIENMSTHQCGQCGHVESIFSQGGGESLSQVNEVPFLGKLPLINQIVKDSDSGIPAVFSHNNPSSDIFLDCARNLIDELIKQPLNTPEEFSENS